MPALHERRHRCTNCVMPMTNSDGALGAASIALQNGAAGGCHRGIAPLSVATRDFNEPIRLRLTGTR